MRGELTIGCRIWRRIPCYFRPRTISYPQSYEHGTGWDAVLKHAYFQPNTLWSDYTPVVCVNCAPQLPRLWLPLIGNAGG